MQQVEITAQVNYVQSKFNTTILKQLSPLVLGGDTTCIASSLLHAYPTDYAKYSTTASLAKFHCPKAYSLTFHAQNNPV
jgi:hypothetical protein